MTEVECIRYYRKVYLQNFGEERRLRPMTSVPADIDVARQFLDWCRQELLDPAAFIDLRFRQLRQRNSYPRFTALRAPALVLEGRRASSRTAAAATQVPTDAQLIRDLSYNLPSQETVRESYARTGKPELCRLNEFSGGFDPRSRFCTQCRIGSECAGALAQRHGFDVSALRSGDLHRLPLEVRKALRNWSGGIR